MITIDYVCSQGPAALASREGFGFVMDWALDVCCDNNAVLAMKMNVIDVICDIAFYCFYTHSKCGTTPCHPEWMRICDYYEVLPF